MVSVACRVVTTLMPAPRVSGRPWSPPDAAAPRLLGPGAPGGGVLHRRDELVLGELEGVCRRDPGQQPPLVRAVVQDRRLDVGARGGELPAAGGIPRRDGGGGAGC